MYGKSGLIPVGGKVLGEDDIESDTEEPGTPTPPPPPRNAGTSEPVAWHSMPELVWQEILFDFKVGAVIDLTLADGQLAQAALQARIPYTGLVFTRRHADELLQKLQSFVLAGATREGDTWYDPRLVESLTASKPKANEKAQTNATVETNAGTKPKKGEQGEACNKALTRRKGIQDGQIWKEEWFRGGQRQDNDEEKGPSQGGCRHRNL
jgi:hypothetical protein